MINSVLRLPVEVTLVFGIAAIAFAFTCSLIRIRKQPLALRCLCFFLGATLCTEVVATYFNIVYENNLAVYQIMGPVILTGSCLYFNYLIPGLKKHYVGYLVAFAGIIFTVVNIYKYEGLHTLNTHFAELECLFNVSFCMYFFYELTRSDEIRYIQRNPNFWIALLFLTFYLVTFLSWGLINVLRRIDREAVGTVYSIVFILNIIFYTGLGIVYLKLVPKSITQFINGKRMH